jgi:MFS family permease
MTTADLRAAPSIEARQTLTLSVLLPFAAGYYLSYVFRTINALIAGGLRADLALGAADLGLLTSVYFLAMAAVQLPFGALLDRYGPRRVQSGCLIVAATGAVIFALAQGLPGLLLGRALLGIGFGATLMAGLKAIVLWVPPARAAAANGWLVTLGALGAVTATAPAQDLVDAAGWRGLFLLLAGATLVGAAVVFVVVPEVKSAFVKSGQSASVTLRSIYRDPRFWKLAPLSATTIGSAWAIQGLWAAPWLAEVEGFDRPTVVRHLMLMAITLCASGVALGRLAGAFRQRGISTESVLGAVAVLGLSAQIAAIARWPIPSSMLWSLMAVGGAATVLSYTILPGYFPKAASGRANAALNLLHLTVAFAVQWLTGVIVDLWSSVDGRHPVEAYQAAFALNLVMQVAAVAWFALPARMSVRRRRGKPASPRPQLLRAHAATPSSNPYQDAQRVWQDRVTAAETQRLWWRRTALGAAVLCALVTSSAVLSMAGPPIVVHVIAAEDRGSSEYDGSIGARR